MLEYFRFAFSVPAVAGLFSATAVFFTLALAFMPTYAKSSAVSIWDPPTTLLTAPMLKYVAPIAFSGDAFVDVRFDYHGRVVSYAIIGGTAPGKEHLKRSVENNLLFTEFWPATTFGVPIAGTIRISYQSSAAVDVTE